MSDATRADPSYLELVARMNGVVAVGGASLSALWVVALWGPSRSAAAPVRASPFTADGLGRKIRDILDEVTS